MPRIQKENIKTPFFHIMVQGNNKEYIFNSEEDKNKYLEIMKKTKEKIAIIILEYCMMNNHAHLLFYEEDTKNLTQYMHRVNLLYAKYYNKKYNRVGYVFRDRYKTQPIYSEKHLYSCVRYIHNNPVKANLVKKPNEYQYSSYGNNIFYTNTKIEQNIKKYMHVQESSKLNDDEDFMFMENEVDKEEIAKDLIDEIMKEKRVTRKELSKNDDIIYLIIKKLKYANGISYRMIENLIRVNRKRLKQIEQKQGAT